MNSPITSTYYHVGGALPTQATSYVTRKADRELYDGLKSGEFCYVFNARQMGKSSLRIQTITRLEAEDFTCMDIDMSLVVNDNITPAQWYAGILSRLARHPNLVGKFNLRTWLKEHDYLDQPTCLSTFIEDVLLENITTPTVVFIDEIDSTLALDFSVNDFFEIIRSCHHQCRQKSCLPCLTFVLLGVTTPYDLLKDKPETSSTPFNIGKAINLCGFTFAEAQPLADGLVDVCQSPDRVLEEVLSWTAGKPFLTQKICQLITKSGVFINSGSEAIEVKTIVQEKVITNWESQDFPEHLKTIRDRLLFPDNNINRRLGIYQSILQKTILADNSKEQRDLRLTGIVTEQEGKLKIANPIYETIFNSSWVEQKLHEIRPYTDAFNAWIESNQKNSSYLLKGKELTQALEWSSDKLLSQQDFEFLTQSQQCLIKSYEARKDMAIRVIKEKSKKLQEQEEEQENLLKVVEQLKKQKQSLFKSKKASESERTRLKKQLTRLIIGSIVLTVATAATVSSLFLIAF